MLRILGAVLVIAGCHGIGLCLCEKEERVIAGIKEWKYSLQLIASEISYKKQPISFALKECSRKVGGEVGKVYEDFLAALNRGEEEPRDIWRRGITDYLKKTILPAEGKKKIESLLKVIGYEDESMQIKMLHMEIENLEKYEEQLEEERKVKRKITILLSSCSGIVLALLLI